MIEIEIPNVFVYPNRDSVIEYLDNMTGWYWTEPYRKIAFEDEADAIIFKLRFDL